MIRPFMLVLFLTLRLCAAAQYTLQEEIDIQHYAFRLELNDTTDIIHGEATVKVLFTRPASAFELDLANVNASEKGMTVQSITSNNKPVAFTHRMDRLQITLATAARQNEVQTFVIIYQGVPQDGLIISKNKYGDRTFFGDNWPDRAHHWLPVVDHPADKAGVDFIVFAPPHYEVVGNGVKLEESYVNEKQKRTHWHEDVSISTKVMVIGAARFAIQHAGDVNGIPVESWVYPQNRAEGFHDYAAATRVLDFFHNHIGPYSYKKLANVQSKTRYGGMENASNIFYFENSVTGKADHEDLIAHEVAHQWFGNSASEKDWHHVWLSEGFATYFTHVYNEFTYGRDRMAEGLSEDRRKVIEYANRRSLPVVFSALPRNLTEILSANSYQKGSWILHMLRYDVGDDAFWRGIRRYYHTYRNSNAATGDFQRIMEEESGRDLKPFFDQWLYQAGHPVLKGTWRYDPKTKTVVISVVQEQRGSSFNNIPLEIGIYYPKQEKMQLEKVRVEKESNKFSFPAEEKPSKIALDPRINLLFEGGLDN